MTNFPEQLPKRRRTRMSGVLQPVPQEIVFRLKERFELRPRARCQLPLMPVQEALQQNVQLFHAPPAQPLESSQPHRTCRHAPQFRAASGRVVPIASDTAAGDHHFLDFGNGFGGIQSFGTGTRAIHDGMAAVQTEWIFQFIQALTGRFVT